MGPLASAPRCARSNRKSRISSSSLRMTMPDTCLGCDGNPRAETPNLDRLASEGTRFASNYCNSPVCTPSRQSFFTGQMPHAAGVTTLCTSLDPAKPTIAKQLETGRLQDSRLRQNAFQPARSARACTVSMKC